jgi:hypothetical protein
MFLPGSLNITPSGRSRRARPHSTYIVHSVIFISAPAYFVTSVLQVRTARSEVELRGSASTSRWNLPTSLPATWISWLVLEKCRGLVYWRSQSCGIGTADFAVEMTGDLTQIGNTRLL